jgi:DNA-binding response OmpR family regulator
VLVLTGRPDLRDVVACLEVGADDYMVKPFRFEELLARIRARLRERGDGSARQLQVGRVALDLATRRATVGGRTVDLTAREFALLQTFMRHPDQVLSRQQLLADGWGYDFDPGTNVVNVFVSGLRRKLGDEVIETARGMGYRFRG